LELELLADSLFLDPGSEISFFMILFAESI